MVSPVSRLPLSAMAILLTGAMACTCSGGGNGRNTGGGTGAGTASGSASGPLDPRCVQARPAIEALYRAEATTAKLEPARIEESVSDNTTMVLAECARRPQVAACAGKVRSALQLENDCLEPLDDEGTEGTRIRR